MEPKQPLELTFKITFQEYRESQINSPWRVLSIFLLLSGIWLSCLVMLPDIAIDLNYLSRNNLAIAFYACLALSIIIYLAFQSNYSFIYQRKLLKTWKDSKLINTPQHLQVSDWGISTRTSHTKAERSWQRYTNYTEKDNIFILYFFNAESNILTQIIPKQVLRENHTIENFRDLLKTHIKVQNDLYYKS